MGVAMEHGVKGRGDCLEGVAYQTRAFSCFIGFTHCQ